MKIKTLVVLTVSILFALCPTDGFCEERIVGAFGMRLGDVFDPSTAIGTASLTDGTPLYQFSPQNQFRSFGTYYVEITPETNRIYTIWGVGSVDNNQKCTKEQDLLMSLLEEKYGKAVEEELYSSLYDLKSIMQGSRLVAVKCDGLFDVTINIRYKDSDLEEIADQEHLKIEGNNVDSSGL